MKTHYLYTLNCPIDKCPKYVGISISPKRRLSNHISKARQSTSTKKKAWIKSLLNKGLKPKLKIVSEHTKNDIEQAERNYIKKLKKEGYNLYNLTSGGEIKKKVSSSTKQKLREINLGKKQSEETIRKRVEKLKGQKRNKETKKILSKMKMGNKNPMFGKTISEEQKEAIRQANYDREYGEKLRNKISKANSKKVVQLDMNDNFIKIWNSMTEVENELGINNGDISSVCKGRISHGYKRKSAGGFKWKYLEDYETNQENNS